MRMTQTNQPRRWFRFGLRTLFMVVTLFGVWLAVQVKWIRDRRAFLSQEGVWNLTIEQLLDPFDNELPEDELLPAPGVLWLFGEKGIPGILIDRTKNSAHDEARRREAMHLFPEAYVEMSSG